MYLISFLVLFTYDQKLFMLQAYTSIHPSLSLFNKFPQKQFRTVTYVKLCFQDICERSLNQDK